MMYAEIVRIKLKDALTALMMDLNVLLVNLITFWTQQIPSVIVVGYKLLDVEAVTNQECAWSVVMVSGSMLEILKHVLLALKALMDVLTVAINLLVLAATQDTICRIPILNALVVMMVIQAA